jgi:hypothetical protein
VGPRRLRYDAWAMETFQACGSPSWLSFLIALGGIAFSTVALSRALLRAPRALLLSWAALVVALLPAGVGVAGLVIGRSRIEGVIAAGFADPSQLVAIREEGYRYAGSCVTVGVAFTALPLLLAALALAAAYMLRAGPGAPHAGAGR